MNVLKEILEWSQGRPVWQRDALRRLLLIDELSDDDLHELTEICKSTHGLASQQKPVCLAKEYLPKRGSETDYVTLDSIFHQCGVNALAENQTLNFASGLTVVYGDNAAGKTGYIRILKSACRARGQEEILGNVLEGGTSLTPVIAIKYRIGTEENLREWSGQREDVFISRVSVFDSQCSAVYLTEKTDVAFRPFGLDLFDKLVQVCKAVRARLENEKNHLNSIRLTELQSQIPEGTEVAKFLEGITSLTKPDKVHTLARLSPDEEERLELLEKSLFDLQANDPKKLIQQLKLRAGRVRDLISHLKNIETILSVEAVTAVFEARAEVYQKSEEASKLRSATFHEDVLEGTGSELWKVLWESARRFSQELVYPKQQFPVVENGVRCVLCQQKLDQQASNRLKQFEKFVASTTEREFRESKEKFEWLHRKFIDFRVTNDAINDTLKEIHIEHEVLSDSIVAAIEANKNRRERIVNALASDNELDPACPELVMIARETETFVEQLEERIETLRSNTTEETRKNMNVEAQELRARKLLAKHKELVLDEIERKKKIAAYELCINDTRTQAITQKSTAVTKKAVTQKLKQSFKDELSNLNFLNVKVELNEVGGEEGILYHKLILTRAPSVQLPKIASEGEQRCLSFAAFFAELSTADDQSSIVFDDPVSSLDYKWREGVAWRLVKEAKHRQVIVFTHDIVFLLLLKQLSYEQGVEQLDQYVRQLPIGAGVCTQELPWVALKVSKRIGHLKKLLQDAEKLHSNGHLDAYEREASLIYGNLREAWERGIEEVLLSGVVERYRPGVQTQQIAKIADITAEDCKTVEIAMTKCSKWLPGHDQAAAARADIPEPSQLKDDIEALESWVSSIRKRRR